MSIPFGAHLSLELRDKLGTIIPASFSLVPKTFVLPDISVSSANPTGKIQLEGNSLYPNRIALLFGQDSGKVKQNLITVHMGTQQLMVSPEGKNSISISLISVPARIGNDNNSFDSVIRGRAHKTGFPPQYIKAQIRKEAAGNAFNPNSYRYEPDYDRVRQTPDSLNEIAYARYVFSSAGRAPSNEQVHPRSLYKLYPGLEENRITDNYEYTFNPYKAIKANNIVYEFSNSSQNWYLPKVLSNGTTIPVDYDALEVKLDFVAQTVTASSYGLLQVMYRTAVEARDYFDYQTIDGENFYKRGKDPIALFQPELNLKVGVGYLVKSYRTMNALYQKNISVVNEIETYNDYMSNAFAGYNGSFTKESAEKNKRVLDYKKDVISILPRYLIKF